MSHAKIPEIMRLLSDEGRRSILELIAIEPRGVDAIAEKLGISEAAARDELALLERARLITPTRGRGHVVFAVGEVVMVDSTFEDLSIAVKLPEGGSFDLSLPRR